MTKKPANNDETLLKDRIQEDIDTYSSYVQESLVAGLRAIQDEDQNWTKLLGGTSDPLGPRLEDVKETAELLREAMSNPWMKRGLGARSSFVWSGGINIDGYSKETRGRGVNLQKFMDDPVNQLSFFGAAAHKRIDGALYTDSQPFIIGDESGPVKRLRQVGIADIEAVYGNPEFPDEVWAYKRSYQQLTTDGEEKTITEWIFHHDFLDQRAKVGPKIADVKVSQTKVMFGRPVNRLAGERYGAPDSLAAWQWIRKYRDGLMDGLTMQKALASIAYTVTVGSARGGQNASAVASTVGNGSAGAYVQGQGNSLMPVSTAGKGYDFDSLRAIISGAAAALEVSVVILTSDPGAAGSSYGSASTLSLPDKLAVIERRQYHIDLYESILEWAGADMTKLRVWFTPLDDATEVYRKMQTIVLAWNSGVVKPEIIAEKIIDLFGDNADVDLPNGVMLPNNENSLNRSDIDNDAATSSDSGTNTQAGGGGQGQASGTGGQGGGMGDGGLSESLMNSITLEMIMEKLDAIQSMR